MIKKLVIAVPVAALTLLTFTASMVATSGEAEARRCYRAPPWPGRLVCEEMSTPRPDKPNQQKK